MEKIFVIGAGTMGLDIAQVFAKAGFEVAVQDVSDKILDGTRAKLVKSLEKLVTKGTMSEENKAALLGRMRFTTDVAAAAHADLVIEAVVENMEIKRKVFASLDGICKPETILASNTSSISITAIAAVTSRQDRVIGMHFFNPAVVMKLVEVIRGANTSDETTETVKALASQIGKRPVEVNEGPGFVVNKILCPMINEAVGLLELGVASAEDIDTAMCLGANHPMGPLTLADLIGLDVCLSVMETLHAETGDDKYRPSMLLRKYVRAGKLGRKTGVGFYDYRK
ncbi:3-hydroxybutyryl-CoA dehydrogenase [Papillibacter cinnamivorans]|uniref:3-hydroxybutyryl-CoA dehydrogenase n=1 Tax=Papillibacter cinnamivorans DSM 12816 TaxID=1122930 RepID=A0A1W1YP93_9FIRM|nr:3-hydroxybutyryl-CoA dehydrogenase [Papillibacter cinnamivorans]SMC37969.1 3-hydroxybutyryl-CoA dehydrogenase [Papillibacter cinnamivorans DSM 12816]